MFGPIVAVPLQTQDSVIGVLVALRNADDQPFQPAEVPLLTSFAEQATLALELGEKNRRSASWTCSPTATGSPATCTTT